MQGYFFSYRFYFAYFCNLRSYFSNFENKKSELIYSGLIEEKDKIKNGIHLRTGLIDAEGLMTVVNNYTNCHSAKLVVQNKISTENWNTTIKWRHGIQNLSKSGGNQEVIVNYLVTNYPPTKKEDEQF